VTADSDTLQDTQLKTHLPSCADDFIYSNKTKKENFTIIILLLRGANIDE
jgi:hypothetical protein